jgi:hypothetical protein
MVGAAENGSASAILLRSVHHVGKLVVGDHVVELCGGLVVPCAPGLAAIETDRCPLVRSENHVGWMLGINPNLMVVIPTGCAADN